ncbi:translation initiation inhibitor [Penicillium mononematosum]|uniref:RidA family protein n=2 Tax=Penicillium TaxID=5073 RepID=A0A9W4K400_9EURO|nr:translation initiation inhibitor [Penicillium mononematosum]KAJ5470152.1 translation initiation inhibitor [Penicillium desertorum]KAJ6185622.1 translation initiation inhibitor [Penicillium mononematosum]CAG8886480.1 unnamed protein product [Penicillium egyptiacum]
MSVETFFNKDGVHPIGPYSQVTRGGGFVFLAGQVPTDSAAKPVGNNTTEKARRMCQNAQLMLETAGSSLDKVLKITIYFSDIDRDFEAVNKVFGEFFTSKPARTSVQVARLPLNLEFEMDVTALA